MKLQSPNTKYYPSKSSLLAIAFSLTIFLNFTFAIQYVDLSNFGLSIAEEIVEEEEEKEEHRNDLLEDLINNTNVIVFVNYDLGKVPLMCKYHSDVLTPPPELS